MRALSEQELLAVYGGVDGRGLLTHEFRNNYGHGRPDTWAGQASPAISDFVPERREPTWSR